MCALLNVTVAALCIVQQQCDQSSERRCSWKRSIVFNSAQVYPQSRDLNQIQFTIAAVYNPVILIDAYMSFLNDISYVNNLGKLKVN